MQPGAGAVFVQEPREGDSVPVAHGEEARQVGTLHADGEQPGARRVRNEPDLDEVCRPADGDHADISPRVDVQSQSLVG